MASKAAHTFQRLLMFAHNWGASDLARQSSIHTCHAARRTPHSCLHSQRPLWHLLGPLIPAEGSSLVSKLPLLCEQSTYKAAQQVPELFTCLEVQVVTRGEEHSNFGRPRSDRPVRRTTAGKWTAIQQGGLQIPASEICRSSRRHMALSVQASAARPRGVEETVAQTVIVLTMF